MKTVWSISPDPEFIKTAINSVANATDPVDNPWGAAIFIRSDTEYFVRVAKTEEEIKKICEDYEEDHGGLSWVILNRFSEWDVNLGTMQGMLIQGATIPDREPQPYYELTTNLDGREFLNMIQNAVNKCRLESKRYGCARNRNIAFASNSLNEANDKIDHWDANDNPFVLIDTSTMSILRHSPVKVDLKTGMR